MSRAAPKKANAHYSYTVFPLYPKADTHCWRVIFKGKTVLEDIAACKEAAQTAAESTIVAMVAAKE